MVLAGAVELSVDERAELRAVVNSPDVSAMVATRARIVLWCAEGRQKKDVAVLAHTISEKGSKAIRVASDLLAAEVHR